MVTTVSSIGRSDRVVSDDVTIGEVSRTLGQFRLEVSRQFGDLNRYVGDKLLTSELFHVAHDALANRVKDLETEASRRANSTRNLAVAVLVALLSNLGTVIGFLASRH